MFDTVIVSGGNIQKDFALDFLKKNQRQAAAERLRLIAADRGLEFFRETKIMPDMVVGDFDSLSPAGKNYLRELPEEKILRLKPEKDDSDTQSAVNLAVRTGASRILLLGCTGTRLDHLLANLELLSAGKALGVQIAMADCHNYAALIESGTALSRAEQFGKFVSFFPVGGDVTGLTLEGFKYPLDRHHLTVGDSGLTVSNEMVAERCRVTFEGGVLLMVMSRD